MKTYHSAVANLQRLDDVQQEFCGVAGHEKARSVLCSVVDLPGAVDGAERGRGIWKDTRHADPVRLFGHILETERFANRLL